MSKTKLNVHRVQIDVDMGENVVKLANTTLFP